MVYGHVPGASLGNSQVLCSYLKVLGQREVMVKYLNLFMSIELHNMNLNCIFVPVIC